MGRHLITLNDSSRSLKRKVSVEFDEADIRNS